MALPLLVPALTTAGRFLGQIGLKRIGTNLLTKASTMSSSTATTGASRGIFAKAKDFLIPKSTLGKVGVGGLTAYSVFGGSEAEASQISQNGNDDKMSLWGTAFKVAGIGGIANAVMGGSFFKGALTTGTLALGAVWAWNDLNSNPSTIKGLAEKILPPETYQSIFGNSNNLKEMANLNAQDTQDVKSVQDKTEIEKKEQEQAKQAAFKQHSEEKNKQLLEKDLANANDNVNMAYAVWGDKNMTNEQKTQVIGEAVKQMNETERAEFFKKIENDCQTAINTAVATNDVKGMGQDDKDIQQSYKDAEKAQEQVTQKTSLYNDILGNYGEINKQSQEQLSKIEDRANQAMQGAKSFDDTATNSLTKADDLARQKEFQGLNDEQKMELGKSLDLSNSNNASNQSDKVENVKNQSVRQNR